MEDEKNLEQQQVDVTAPETTQEDNTQEAATQQNQVENPEEQAFWSGMENKYPDLKGNKEALYKAAREGYDKEHELNKKNSDSYKEIYDAIQRSPETARFINRITHPEKGAEPEEAFAEFGEPLVDLLTGKIDNATYRKRKGELAEESKKRAEAKAAEDEMNVKAGEAFVEACKEIGIEPEEAEKQLTAKFNGEGGSRDFRANKSFYTALLQSLSREDDILAAEARGRNAQMQEKDLRRNKSNDGLPRSNGSGAGTAKVYDPNSLEAAMRRRARLDD